MCRAIRPSSTRKSPRDARADKEKARQNGGLAECRTLAVLPGLGLTRTLDRHERGWPRRLSLKPAKACTTHDDLLAVASTTHWNDPGTGSGSTMISSWPTRLQSSSINHTRSPACIPAAALFLRVSTFVAPVGTHYAPIPVNRARSRGVPCAKRGSGIRAVTPACPTRPSSPRVTRR